MYIDKFLSETKALQREGVVKEKWVICAVNDKKKSERYRNRIQRSSVRWG